MNLVARQIYGNKKGGVPNTFIGGVASTINTPALLAAKLAIDVIRITGFSFVGSDIKCRITGSYGLPTSCFSNDAKLTYYLDGGLITSLAENCFCLMTAPVEEFNFKNCLSVQTGTFIQSNNIKRVILENATYIGSDAIKQMNSLQVCYIPKTTTLGATVGSNNVFTAASPKIYTHPSLATNNGGSPDGDLTGKNVVYVTNFTAPNSITNLSITNVYATAIQLNFTPPTGNTNAIDYYECYVNGVYKNNILASGGYITGLMANTSYTIKLIPVDIFYNKSTSNIITTLTSATYVIPASNIVSCYEMENNVLDTKGINNGVATAITYGSGLVNQAAVFNGTNSKIVYSNSANLQLNNGSISVILKASSSGSSYRGIVVKQYAYGLFLNNGVLVLYDWTANLERSTGVNLNDGLNHVLLLTFQSGVANGTKVYVDGNLVLTTTVTILNHTVELIIGSGTPTAQFINAQIDEVAIWNLALSLAEVSDITAKLNSGQHLI